MELSMVDLCQAFMHEANRLADACVTLLGELGDKPEEVFNKRFKKRKAARISTKTALKELPKTIKLIKKLGCTIDKDKNTTWKIYIDDGDEYPKVGVIKPLTGKIELMEKIGRETKYRTCTIEELEKAVVKIKKEMNSEEE